MSIVATLYIPPNGRTREIVIANINADDEAWFKAHHAKISLEELGGQNVIYADVGIVEDGEVVEAIEIDRGRSCWDTMAALRKQCEAMLARKEATNVARSRA